MLTQQQIDEFHSNGVIIVPDVLPAAVLNAVKDEYALLLDELYEHWHAQGLVPAPDGMDFWQKLLVSYAAGCDWFQPMDISLPGGEIRPDTPFHFGPAVFDMITAPRLLDLVECLIGSEITSNPIQHVRLKPPAPTLSGVENRAHIMMTDWHQDRAVAHEEGDRTDMVTVWLAISDATVENGCLQAIPGKPQMYPHCPRKQTAIADGFLDLEKAQPLPVKAGGAVIFHPLTPHASLNNVSDRFRWSFDIRYNVTGQPTGRAHFPDFVVRSHRRPENVLTDWQEWRRMWLAARARLAGQPHIPIHRWTSDSPACA
ncbi:Protein involved in biosynthesis of mitomycin antibiotics/polyketide fumonisin [Hoeflea phototrophica DFL-43]|jgi:ectoine hydroxylase-related dioxygenase (phytanoyl-CoA dioxygenase family)|uniref:Protein involved in biosynthesis of mitomycin antibiotics/polyketide fumonisin n=1 Tax=Hoeflea phototrophica (strain DSM 17068 / NCIMB 14078 / DFL-43) TaxID=411684 RepID=A9DBK1_HOEPD|nr:phytanoyl-CoA dioxygenase family protein [Hoeflea phototrophica]EDQ32540.1 Protein involved in biosynthesis of mitomycin antibiotics/polyketide fumonisin [Hoeflea phototrophica DFL-43]